MPSTSISLPFLLQRVADKYSLIALCFCYTFCSFSLLATQDSSSLAQHFQMFRAGSANHNPWPVIRSNSLKSSLDDILSHGSSSKFLFSFLGSWVLRDCLVCFYLSSVVVGEAVLSWSRWRLLRLTPSRLTSFLTERDKRERSSALEQTTS